jgi:hypothetical protein
MHMFTVHPRYPLGTRHNAGMAALAEGARRGMLGPELLGRVQLICADLMESDLRDAHVVVRMHTARTPATCNCLEPRPHFRRRVCLPDGMMGAVSFHAAQYIANYAFTPAFSQQIADEKLSVDSAPQLQYVATINPIPQPHSAQLQLVMELDCQMSWAPAQRVYIYGRRAGGGGGGTKV